MATWLTPIQSCAYINFKLVYLLSILKTCLLRQVLNVDNKYTFTACFRKFKQLLSLSLAEKYCSSAKTWNNEKRCRHVLTSHSNDILTKRTIWYNLRNHRDRSHRNMISAIPKAEQYTLRQCRFDVNYLGVMQKQNLWHCWNQK